MDSQMLPLMTTNSPLSLSSWPLLKYSSSTSSISDSAQSPWSHFPHRDNVFLVIDTHRVPGYIHNDGKFIDRHTRLKVVWGLETMESLDLTTIATQALPSRDSSQTRKPAFMALGRSPSLAIKYYKAEDQTFRRFQIKFESDDAYQSAAALLEQAGCLIGKPLTDKYEQSSQFQVAQAGSSVPPRDNTIQVLRTPPGSSSGYKPSVPSNLYQTINAKSAHSYLAPQKPRPDTMKLPDMFPEDEIPPPRPPSSFLSRKLPAQNPMDSTNNRASVCSIDNLPPLPKPTPVNRVHTAVFPKERTPAYCGPEFNDSSRPRSGTGAQQQNDNQSLVVRGRVGNYNVKLPEIAEEHDVVNAAKDRGGVPVFPDTYKNPELRTGNLGPAIPRREGQKTSGTIIPMATAGARNPETGGRKRKQDNNGNEGQEPKKKKGDQPRIREEEDEEEFKQVEDFIINAIHDDEFLKLLEMVGGVWQRMGFDEIRRNLSGTGA